MDVEILGQTMWLSGIRGKVGGIQKWTETHVRSEGGGGQVYGNSHYVSGSFTPAKVSSTIVNRQSFWIVGPNSGKEVEIHGNYQVRDGQDVTVIWGALKNQRNGTRLFIHNRNTGTHWYHAESVPSNIRYTGCPKFVLIALAVISASFFMMNKASYVQDDTRAGDMEMCWAIIFCALLFGIVMIINRVGENRKLAQTKIMEAINNPAFQSSLPN